MVRGSELPLDVLGEIKKKLYLWDNGIDFAVTLPKYLEYYHGYGLF